MSEAMIIRRGGNGSSGEGFDSNGAVLKVITSTNCTILVTGTGYSKTHQQADGFPRSDDADVTEHFFSIPTSTFGTITVKATNTYGDNTKTLTIDTAGKVYKLLCGGINIILNSTFGLQDGFSTGSFYYTYDDRYKRIEGNVPSGSNTSATLSPAISVGPYEHFTVSFSSYSNSYTPYIHLTDQDNHAIASVSTNSTSVTQKTSDITNKYYPTASIELSAHIVYITEIVLS